MHEQSFPDPLNEPIFSTSFAEEQQKLTNKIENLQMFPHLPLMLFSLFCIIPVVVLLFMTIAKQFSFELLFVTFIPAVSYYFYIKSLERDLETFLLCKRNNWAFNPNYDIKRPKRMAQYFPDVFNRGHSASFDNQIWGSVNTKKENAFWSCMFSYIVGEGRGSSYYEQQVLIVELDKKLPMNFVLFRYGFRLLESVKINELTNRETMHRDLETESEEFNKLFKIKYTEKSLDSKREIISVLSPSVQVRLIDFAKQYSLDCITFQNNCMIVLFSSEIWKAKHTNFFKNVMIDDRDVKRFDELMKQIIALPAEMIRFLD
jgi:hypothetical protein